MDNITKLQEGVNLLTELSALDMCVETPAEVFAFAERCRVSLRHATEYQAALDAINNQQEAINKAVSGYADMHGMSVEDALTALQNAMVAHEAAKQADVRPINNAAEVLRDFKPGAAAMAVPAAKVGAAAAAAVH